MPKIWLYESLTQPPVAVIEAPVPMPDKWLHEEPLPVLPPFPRIDDPSIDVAADPVPTPAPVPMPDKWLHAEPLPVLPRFPRIDDPSIDVAALPLPPGYVEAFQIEEPLPVLPTIRFAFSEFVGPLDPTNWYGAFAARRGGLIPKQLRNRWGRG